MRCSPNTTLFLKFELLVLLAVLELLAPLVGILGILGILFVPDAPTPNLTLLFPLWVAL